MKKMKNILVLLITTVLIQTISYSEVIHQIYENKIPLSVNVNILNEELEKNFLNYVYIKSLNAPVMMDPKHTSRQLVKFPFYTKLKALEKIEDPQYVWYKVELIDINGNKTYGYIESRYVTFREFRFEEMAQRVKNLQNFIQEEMALGKSIMSTNTYVPNPSNSNMDRAKDKYGVSADQNAEVTYNGETIFIPDRSIVSIDSISGDKAKVNTLGIKEKGLEINKSILTNYPKIDPEFRKVIVIDLENENQGVFQKNVYGEWELISYALNKTGAESQLGFETPKGNFIVPGAKFEMGYRDENNKDAGKAKYAIRFSGGGYIHGTPIDHTEEPNREYFVKQKERTLGTVSGTRKCIRNTEKHIKFLFDWVTNKKINEKSNAQRPDENVMVIVF